MIPAGYTFKKVESRPDWLKAEDVADICSVSACISKSFPDYGNVEKRNGYGLLNSPDLISAFAEKENPLLQEMVLFYYEVHEKEYDEDRQEWFSVVPSPGYATKIQVPDQKTLQGFDVITYYEALLECSPLSCNRIAETVPVNGRCLFNTFSDAKESLEKGLFDRAEPGPYRILAVYKTPYPELHEQIAP